MHFRNTAVVIVGLLTGGISIGVAQQASEPVVVSNWPAPLYYQLPEQESDNSKGRQRAAQADISGLSSFVAVTPCRIVDTRGESGQTGSYGAPIMEPGQTRTFALKNMPFIVSPCGISTLAIAYSLNVTVIPAGSKLDYLTAWPSGSGRPTVSTLNSPSGQVLANAAIVPAGTNGAISVFVTDRTHVVIDINGYYSSQPPESFLRAISYRTSSFQAVTTTTSTLNFSAANTNTFEPGSVETGSAWRFQTTTPGLYAIAVNGTGSGGLIGTTFRIQVIQKDPPALSGELITSASGTLGLISSGPTPISASATVYLPANKWVYVTADSSLYVNFNGEISIVRLTF